MLISDALPPALPSRSLRTFLHYNCPSTQRNGLAVRPRRHTQFAARAGTRASAARERHRGRPLSALLVLPCGPCREPPRPDTSCGIAVK